MGKGETGMRGFEERERVQFAILEGFCHISQVDLKSLKEYA